MRRIREEEDPERECRRGDGTEGHKMQSSNDSNDDVKARGIRGEITSTIKTMTEKQ